MGTMTLLALTYTRDATTGPMLTGGRAEGARQGGMSGMILPPPACKFNRKTILLRCRRKAALQREQSQACLASVEREQARPKVKAASHAAESLAHSRAWLAYP